MVEACGGRLTVPASPVLRLGRSVLAHGGLIGEQLLPDRGLCQVCTVPVSTARVGPT